MLRYKPLTRFSATYLLILFLILVTALGFGSIHAAHAQADARRELQKINQEYQRLIADEREYTQSTKQHMDAAITTLLESLGFGYLKARFGADAADLVEDVYTLKRNIDAGASGNHREQAEILIAQIASKIANKIADNKGPITKALVGQSSSMVNTVFHLLYLWQDNEQRKVLDKRREELDRLREYWTNRAENSPWGNPPNYTPANSNTRDAEFQRALSRLGVRITIPSQAAKQGIARIAGVAKEGYSRTDVQIVSRSDDWLALDFSGAYLIPTNGTSSSQRLGLVSVIRGQSSRRMPTVFPEHRSLLNEVDLMKTNELAVFVKVNHLNDQIGAYSDRHWVLVAPRASVTILFHTVCLDKSRGVPRGGEGFYISDQPLPSRIQRILIAASLNGEVPQSQIWGTIEAEQIKWYDPRDDVGTLEISFTGDSSTYGRDSKPINLGATIWIDGKVIIASSDVRDRVFSASVHSGTHILEILPQSSVGTQTEASKMQVEIKIVRGQTSRYKSTLRMMLFPQPVIRVDKFTKVRPE